MRLDRSALNFFDAVYLICSFSWPHFSQEMRLLHSRSVDQIAITCTSMAKHRDHNRRLQEFRPFSSGCHVFEVQSRAPAHHCTTLSKQNSAFEFRVPAALFAHVMSFSVSVVVYSSRAVLLIYSTSTKHSFFLSLAVKAMRTGLLSIAITAVLLVFKSNHLLSPFGNSCWP